MQFRLLNICRNGYPVVTLQAIDIQEMNLTPIQIFADSKHCSYKCLKFCVLMGVLTHIESVDSAERLTYIPSSLTLKTNVADWNMLISNLTPEKEWPRWSAQLPTYYSDHNYFSHRVKYSPSPCSASYAFGTTAARRHPSTPKRMSECASTSDCITGYRCHR